METGKNTALMRSNFTPSQEVLSMCPALPRPRWQSPLHQASPPPLAGPFYHDALGGDPHCLGNLPALVTVGVVVCLE